MLRSVLVVVGLASIVACGNGADGGDGSAAGAPGAGTSTNAGGGGSGPGTGGAAGRGGGGGTNAAGGGAAGSSNASCTGNFGPPELLFSDTTTVMGTPSLTDDELMMVYIDSLGSMTTDEDRIVYRSRATRAEPFSEPVVLPEVSDQCDQTLYRLSVHVSRDGLRLYWVCSELAGTSGDLRMATRTSRSAPFAIATRTFGRVGRAFSLSADELTLVSNSTTTSWASPDIYRRTSTQDEFGTPVRALEVDTALEWPELGPDGLTLFGTLRDANYTQLAVARRSSATSSFTGVTTMGLPAAPMNEFFAGAALGGDCRSIYFVRVVSNGTATPRAMYVARR